MIRRIRVLWVSAFLLAGAVAPWPAAVGETIDWQAVPCDRHGEPEASDDVTSPSWPGRPTLMAMAAAVAGPLTAEPAPEHDRVVVDGDAFAGTVVCEQVTVATPLGAVTVDWSDVAMVAATPGAVARPVVVLRTGEMFRGAIDTPAAHFTDEQGMTMTLDLNGIDLLMVKSLNENTLPTQAEGAVALLAMHNGNQIALTAVPEQPMRLASPWGSRRVTFNTLMHLRQLPGPSGHRYLTLRDGSRYRGLLAGEASIHVASQRFGELAVMPTTIAGYTTFEQEADPSAPAEAYVQTTAGGLLVGTASLDSVYRTDGDMTQPIAPAEICCIDRDADAGTDADPRFRVTLRDGTQVQAQLRTRAWRVQTEAEMFTVPIRQLLAYRRPADEP